MDEVGPAVLHLGQLSSSSAQDALRQAAATAAKGHPVWIVRRDGTRIGAIVSVERASELAAHADGQ